MDVSGYMDITISESYNTVTSRYEVHDTICNICNIEKNVNFVHFKVKLFYLMHFESSKLRAPTHVLN